MFIPINNGIISLIIEEQKQNIYLVTYLNLLKLKHKFLSDKKKIPYYLIMVDLKHFFNFRNASL